MYAVDVQGDNCAVVEALGFDVEAFVGRVAPADADSDADADAESQDADCSLLGSWKAAISAAGVAVRVTNW